MGERVPRFWQRHNARGRIGADASYPRGSYSVRAIKGSILMFTSSVMVGRQHRRDHLARDII